MNFDINIYLLPLLYHFENFGILLELIFWLGNTVDVFGIFILTFIIINALLIYKDFWFQVFYNFIFKVSTININSSILLTYFTYFYNGFLNLLAYSSELFHSLSKKWWLFNKK